MIYFLKNVHRNAKPSVQKDVAKLLHTATLSSLPVAGCVRI
jgi:hypothetical protein